MLGIYLESGFTILLRGGIGELFASYPAVGILLASGGFFYGGYQSLKERRTRVAFQWQLIAAFMSLAFSIGALFSKMWFSGLFAVVLFGVEVWLMKRWYRPGKSR